MEKIILFGGTFDPIHNGHLFIARKVLEITKANKVIFIPAKNPRWKQPIDSCLRKEMLSLALKNEQFFEISDVELEAQTDVSYSIDTVKYFKKLYPAAELMFLIGFDQVDNLNKWHEIDELSKLVQIIAVARPTYPSNHEFIKKYNVKVIEIGEYNISSSDIRALKSLDTPKVIIDYIIDHELYFVKTVKAYLSKNRYDHVLRVSNLAYDIASLNGVNAWKTYMASYLHDIAKEMSIDQTIRIMMENYAQYIDLPSYTYHQFVGAFVANQYFNITDEQILDAIRFHTTGKKAMHRISKIVYAADKIEEGRGYDSKDMIQAMKENLRTGFKYVLLENQKYLSEYNGNRLSDECYSYYLSGKEK